MAEHELFAIVFDVRMYRRCTSSSHVHSHTHPTHVIVSPPFLFSQYVSLPIVHRNVSGFLEWHCASPILYIKDEQMPITSRICINGTENRICVYMYSTSDGRANRLRYPACRRTNDAPLPRSRRYQSRIIHGQRAR